MFERGKQMAINKEGFKRGWVFLCGPINTKIGRMLGLGCGRDIDFEKNTWEKNWSPGNADMEEMEGIK